MTDEVPPVVTGTGAPWHEGVQGDELGYIQNRGWDKLSAKDATLAAIKSYREVEKFTGVPADQLLRLPKDINDKAGWATLREKTGVPIVNGEVDKTKYDFSALKFADGTALDEKTVERFRDMAAASALTKDGAVAVAQAIVKSMDETKANDAAAYELKLGDEKKQLATSWGGQAAANKVIAENAAAALGVNPEAVALLEKSVGYSAVMEMFLKIGQKIGEDKFVSNGAGGGTLSREQASDTLKQRMLDTAWVAKLDAGDSITMKEFDNLTRIKAGV